MIIKEATLDHEAELIQFYIRMNEVLNRRTKNYNPDNSVFPSVDMIHTAILNQQQFIGIEDDRIVIACIANHDCDSGYSKAAWQVEAGEDEFWVQVGIL